MTSRFGFSRALDVLRTADGVIFLVTLAAALPSSNSTRAQESAFPSRVTNFSAESTGSGIVLTWDAPAEGSVVGYRIHRQWLSDGLEELTSLVDTHTSDTTYTDTKIEPGVLYLYHVRALFTDGALGDWSRSLNARALTALPGVVPPSPPVYRWRVVHGELPPGLFLDESTGRLYGIPGEAGRYSVKVKVQRMDNE